MTSILYYFGLILLKLSSVDSFFLSFSITISSQSIFFSIFSYRFKTRSLITIIQGIIFLENLTAIFFLSLFNVIFPSHELNRFEFLFQIFLLTAFTGSLIIIGGYLIPKFINKIYLSRDLLLAFVFILIGLIAIGGILIGVNPYTLIFILGMIIGITKARETISEIIYPFKEIFSIFFYITFGFLINIFYFPSIYHIIFSVIILSVTVKYLSITFTLISFGYISKKSLPIISFTQPGEITLIIALISYLSNIISSLTFNSIIFVVIFITIINFLLLHFIKRFQISIKQK
jgi:Kef-type K+ transport system, predicted NAD-binding component